MTKNESKEFLVIPFGLCNALTTFCQLINDVLFDSLDVIVVTSMI